MLLYGFFALHLIILINLGMVLIVYYYSLIVIINLDCSLKIIRTLMKITIPTYVSAPWEYTKSTRPYQAFETLVNKIIDFVYPENELTKRKNFKFIPNFVINALGNTLYRSACPSHETLKSTESDPNALVGRVDKVFDKLVAQVKEEYPSTRNIPWEIRVKKDSNLRAFSCPGGKVCITTGILAMLEKEGEINNTQLEDLIAAALSHEIAHIVAGHSSERTQSALFLDLLAGLAEQRKMKDLFYKVSKNVIPFFQQEDHKQANEFESDKQEAKDYRRANEFEADRFGIEIAHKANYNIDASVVLQKIFLKIQETTSSHPPCEERLQENQKTINRLRGRVRDLG